MRRSSRIGSAQKVSYTVVEAAIRWSGLTKQEKQILGALAQTPHGVAAYRRWPELQLNFDRLVDGIRNQELPASVAGDLSQATIRHVDLKSWMTRFYPECRPEFLFGSLRRTLRPEVSIETLHALLIEREALRAHIELLRTPDQRNNGKIGATSARSSPRVPSLDTRGETTHLNILGCLLKLMLGSSPSGKPYSAFRSQESIINAMIAEDGDRLGISQRTLEAKFAAARRALNR